MCNLCSYRISVLFSNHPSMVWWKSNSGYLVLTYRPTHVPSDSQRFVWPAGHCFDRQGWVDTLLGNRSMTFFNVWDGGGNHRPDCILLSILFFKKKFIFIHMDACIFTLCRNFWSVRSTCSYGNQLIVEQWNTTREKPFQLKSDSVVFGFRKRGLTVRPTALFNAIMQDVFG